MPAGVLPRIRNDGSGEPNDPGQGTDGGTGNSQEPNTGGELKPVKPSPGDERRPIQSVPSGATELKPGIAQFIGLFIPVLAK
nr:Uncharacterised protein [Streptococcus thermophilus]